MVRKCRSVSKKEAASPQEGRNSNTAREKRRRESRGILMKENEEATFSLEFTFTVHHLVQKNSATPLIIHNFPAEPSRREGYFSKVFPLRQQPSEELLPGDLRSFQNFALQRLKKSSQPGARGSCEDSHARLSREKQPFLRGPQEPGLPEKTLSLKFLSMQSFLGLQRKKFRKIFQPGKAEAFQKIHGLGRGNFLLGIAVETQKFPHPKGFLLGPAPSPEKGETFLSHLPGIFLFGGSKKIQKKSPGGAGKRVSSPAA
jgi:hypothetical protein